MLQALMANVRWYIISNMRLKANVEIKKMYDQGLISAKQMFTLRAWVNAGGKPNVSHR